MHQQFITMRTQALNQRGLEDILDVAWENDNTLLVLLSFQRGAGTPLYRVQLTGEKPVITELATFKHAKRILYVPR